MGPSEKRKFVVRNGMDIFHIQKDYRRGCRCLRGCFWEKLRFFVDVWGLGGCVRGGLAIVQWNAK